MTAMRWVQVLAGPGGDTDHERIGDADDIPAPVAIVVDPARPGRGDAYALSASDETERVAWYAWVATVDDMLTTDETVADAVAERIAAQVAPWCLGRALSALGRNLTSRRNTHPRPE